MLLKGTEEPGLYETGMGNRKQRTSRENGRVTGDRKHSVTADIRDQRLLITSPSHSGRPYS